VVKAPKSSLITPILRSLHCSRSTNACPLYTNSFQLPTKFLQPANLTTTDYLYTILSLFSLHVEPAPHLLSLVTLAQSSVSSSLQMQPLFHASPYLWNHLPSSFRQPSSVHCPPGSPHPAHHLITVTTFTPNLKLISFTNPFISSSLLFLPDFTDLVPVS